MKNLSLTFGMLLVLALLAAGCSSTSAPSATEIPSEAATATLSKEEQAAIDAEKMRTSLMSAPPGNYISFSDALANESDDGMRSYPFFVSPSDFFGQGPDTMELTVQAESGLDVSVAIVDTSTGDTVVLTEIDDAGEGETEDLAITLPDTAPQTGVYAIEIIAVSGTGDIQVEISASPAVAVSIKPGWEINGVLGEKTALGYLLAGLNRAEIIFTAAPWPDQPLDLFINAIDTGSGESPGTLDNTGSGEAESSPFIFSENFSIFLFVVGDQQGQAGLITVQVEE